jgi:hypothetical protein
MTIPEFQLLLARWFLYKLSPEELVDGAVGLLVSDIDTPSLRQLAGADKSDLWYLNRLLPRICRELGLQLPDEAFAVELIIRQIARDVLEGKLDPFTAKTNVVQDFMMEDWPLPKEVLPLEPLHDETWRLEMLLAGEDDDYGFNHLSVAEARQRLDSIEDEIMAVFVKINARDPLPNSI